MRTWRATREMIAQPRVASLSDDSFDASAEIAGLAPCRKSDPFFKRGLEVPFLNFGEGSPPRILCEESLFCSSSALDPDLESAFWRAPCERRGATDFRSGESGGGVGRGLDAPASTAPALTVYEASELLGGNRGCVAIISGVVEKLDNNFHLESSPYYSVLLSYGKRIRNNPFHISANKHSIFLPLSLSGAKSGARIRSGGRSSIRGKRRC